MYLIFILNFKENVLIIIKKRMLGCFEFFVNQQNIKMNFGCGYFLSWEFLEKNIDFSFFRFYNFYFFFKLYFRFFIRKIKDILKIQLKKEK